MKCLDTCFLIDLLKNKKDAFKLAKNLDQDIAMTTAVNAYELYLGIFLRKSVSQKELFIYSELLKNITVLEFTNRAALKAAEYSADLIKQGKTVDPEDCKIAGIMKANGVDTIVTKNVKHFTRFKGIKVKAY